jgi:hypothetical protein
MPFCRIGESACQAEENRRENGMGKPDIHEWENRTSTNGKTGHPQITAPALTLTFLQPNLKQTDF